MVKGTRIKKNSVIFFLFTLPALLLYLFFIIYPMLSGFFYSMTDWNGLSLSYNFIGLENYVSYFQDADAMSVVGRTFLYTLSLVVIVTVLALAVALMLNHKLKGRAAFRSIYFFPAVMSSITIGLIFNQIYYKVVPTVGKALGLALLSHNPLSNKLTAMPAILFINVWQGTAMPIVILLAGMQAISADLYEAATIDGANARQTLMHITLPLLKPTLAVVMIFSVRSGLMVFDYIKATTNGGPGYATMSIAMFIYKHAFTDMRFAYSSAESFMVFVVISALAIVQLRLIREKE